MVTHRATNFSLFFEYWRDLIDYFWKPNWSAFIGALSVIILPTYIQREVHFQQSVLFEDDDGGLQIAKSPIFLDGWIWWTSTAQAIAIYQHHFILKSVFQTSRTLPQCDAVSQVKETPINNHLEYYLGRIYRTGGTISYHSYVQMNYYPWLAKTIKVSTPLARMRLQPYLSTHFCFTIHYDYENPINDSSCDGLSYLFWHALYVYGPINW